MLIPALLSLALTADSLHLATLGTCGAITDCHVGYRTLGHLNATRSNAVLAPTWFTGTSADLAAIAPRMVDTTRFYLILVDALGDGVSSSASNSTTQAGDAFPPFTLGDMVDAQHRLVVETLGVPHLAAVVGISMGGMQALQWAVRYPAFMDRVVSVNGTPRPTTQDLLTWTSILHALEDARRPNVRTALDLLNLDITTPHQLAATVSRDSFPRWLSGLESDTSFAWDNWRGQLRALIAFHLGPEAEHLTTPMLFVVSRSDRMVQPRPSLTLARHLGARFVVLEGDCGHMAFQCELDTVARAVRAFLTPPGTGPR